MENQPTTAIKNLNWLIQKSEVSKTYPGECVEKSFKGKLPYRMVMDLIKGVGADWDTVSESGQGFNHHWYASKENMGLSYQTKTGLVQFTYYEAI